MAIVDSREKVALITGASSGIGRVTARQLALRGYHVFLACRSEKKTQPVLDEIAKLSGGTGMAEFLPLDLGDLASVRSCARAFLDRGLPLHLLIANAGLAGATGLSKSGFEICFGTCHIGHFLLTQLLLDRLKESRPARIVVVASKLHYRCQKIDFEMLRKRTASVGGLKEYAVAKLSNVLFASELARRIEGSGVTTYSLHPGVVATNVWRSVPWPFASLIKMFMISEEEGARTSLYCATDSALANESGLYYNECRVQRPSALALDASLARRLWDETERWVAAG
jgi:retinol dehydrogenase 12